MPHNQCSYVRKAESVSLNRSERLAILSVFDGDDSLRDPALDALIRLAPDDWLNELDR
jgi:hypothetical protein